MLEVVKPSDFQGMSADRFKALRQLLGLSQAKAADFLGKSAKQVQNYDYGKTKVPPAVAAALEGELARRQRMVPLLGSVPAGPLDQAIEECEEWVEWNRPNPGNVFGLRVRGESMTSAKIEDGDLVFIRSQQSAEIGQPVVARIGDEVTLKRFGRKNGRPQLLGDDLDPIRPKRGEEVEIVGAVVGVWRDYE